MGGSILNYYASKDSFEQFCGKSNNVCASNVFPVIYGTNEFNGRKEGARISLPTETSICNPSRIVLGGGGGQRWKSCKDKRVTLVNHNTTSFEYVRLMTEYIPGFQYDGVEFSTKRDGYWFPSASLWWVTDSLFVTGRFFPKIFSHTLNDVTLPICVQQIVAVPQSSS